jgi:hypothetical protein
MSKKDFFNDLEKCINGWWDSFPPEIQDDINAVYDKHKPHISKEEVNDESKNN